MTTNRVNCYLLKNKTYSEIDYLVKSKIRVKYTRINVITVYYVYSCLLNLNVGCDKMILFVVCFIMYFLKYSASNGFLLPAAGAQSSLITLISCRGSPSKE